MRSPFNNNSIDELFRNELKDHRVAAPKGTWDKINSRLHIKNKPLPLYLAALVFVAALVAVGVWSTSTSNFNSRNDGTKNKPANTLATTLPNNDNKQLKNSIAQNKVALPVVSVPVKHTLAVTRNKVISNIKYQPVANLTSLTSHSSSAIISSPNSITDNANLFYDELQSMPSKMAVGMLVDADNVSYNGITQALPPPATLNNKSIKGFYAGINGAANSVWILDHVALSDNNFSYQFTTGFAYGVQAGYNFSDNFGLETGLTFNAREGQNYIFKLNNIEPENKSVVLNYTEIPVIAKLKVPHISPFTGMPIVLNINIGASYGYLRSAYTFVSGDKTGSQNQYPTNQFNALMGFSYDIYTRHPFSYSFGLMAAYGINTTNNNNQPSGTFNLISPNSRYSNGSDFSNPHNLSVGITAAINYNFSLFHH